MLEKHIKEAVDYSIEKHIQKTIADLVLEPNWVSKVENLVNQNFAVKFSEKISTVDMNTLIVNNIDAGIDRWQDRLKKNFHTTGISDLSTKKELTIMDDAVVVESDIISKNAEIVDTCVTKNMVVNGDLIVKGTVNVDNQSWKALSEAIASWVMSQIDEKFLRSVIDSAAELVTAQISNRGIDLKNATVDGQRILDNGCLAMSIKKSNIEELGVLKKLETNGPSNLNDTLHVGHSRIGINTQDPDSALTVWDEEVCMSMGKLSKDRAYFGTSRSQPLSIGVNKNEAVNIDKDGTVTVKKLRVANNSIGHGTEIPGYSGNKGDIVFNLNHKPGNAFAWMCLGQFRWVELKSA